MLVHVCLVYFVRNTLRITQHAFVVVGAECRPSWFVTFWTICKIAAGRLVITYRMRRNDFTSPSLPFELKMCLELTGDIPHQSIGVFVRRV
jgi:hypothetical protein